MAFIDIEQTLREAANPSRTTLFRWVRDGLFPAPVKLGQGRGGRIAWDSDEVRQWAENHKAARDSQSRG